MCDNIDINVYYSTKYNFYVSKGIIYPSFDECKDAFILYTNPIFHIKSLDEDTEEFWFDILKRQT